MRLKSMQTVIIGSIYAIEEYTKMSWRVVYMRLKSTKLS